MICAKGVLTVEEGGDIIKPACVNAGELSPTVAASYEMGGGLKSNSCRYLRGSFVRINNYTRRFVSLRALCRRPVTGLRFNLLV